VATWSGGLWKTTNNGTTFEPVFDGQSNLNIGDVALAPSNPDIVWGGTCDGKVHVTRDNGGTWTDLTRKIAAVGGPEDYYVSRVFASNHQEGTAYVTKSGYDRDDFRAFVYKTENYGETWTSLAGIRMQRPQDPLTQWVPPGEYVVILEIGGKKLTQKAQITKTMGWSIGPFPQIIK